MAQPTQSNTFTSGPILLPFIRFTLPILLSMFLQALYSAVDLIVISRYCGAAEIAAVAAGGKVMYMIQVVVTGLAMGVTVAIGRYIGEGNFEDAAKSMGSSICVFAAFGALLTGNHADRRSFPDPCDGYAAGSVSVRSGLFNDLQRRHPVFSGI